jgi:sugar phosphate isomerase/epimerase
MRMGFSRRAWLAGASAAVGAGLATQVLTPQPAGAQESKRPEPFGYCLNLSTIQGQKLPLADQVAVAAKAGYQAIEPWVRDLDRYAKEGGSLKALGQRIRDQGLSVPSAIDFFEWIVDDEGRRGKGLEAARRGMDMVQQIGGQRIAAPPVGATNQANFDLHRAAERYRALLELGDQLGVVPQVELWGHSKTLGRLGDTMLVAIESGHAKACVLADVYHLYKGGSGYTGLRLLGPETMHVLHMNDYPAKPSRAEINDAARVYPGDGVAPLKEILRDLRHIGFHGMLSLELFNRDYWNQDALLVARTGLEKTRAAVRSSME